MSNGETGRGDREATNSRDSGKHRRGAVRRRRFSVPPACWCIAEAVLVFTMYTALVSADQTPTKEAQELGNLRISEGELVAARNASLSDREHTVGPNAAEGQVVRPHMAMRIVLWEGEPTVVPVSDAAPSLGRGPDVEARRHHSAFSARPASSLSGLQVFQTRPSTRSNYPCGQTSPPGCPGYCAGGFSCKSVWYTSGGRCCQCG